MNQKSAKILPLSRYEAAQPSDNHPPPPYSASPDDQWSQSGPTLRNWARHLAENSSIVAAILSSRQANAIGPGLVYEPLVKNRRGELIPELNDALRRIHAEWSKDAEVTGEYTRPELERLAWRTWDMDGETFIRRVIRPDGYRLQIIPTEWIPAILNDTAGDDRVVHGIAKDEWGKPIAYFVQPNTFDIYSQRFGALDTSRMTRIPAPDMFHVKRIQRPGQTRGITLLHAVILRVADVSAYQQSHRLAARASADLFCSINRSPDINIDGEAPAERDIHFDNMQIIDGLAAGESVNFHDAKHPNTNAVEFINQEYRAIASATDCGFSQIAQVFDSSYAAQRLEVVDTWRKIERDRSKFIADFARPALYDGVVEQALLQRLLPAGAMRRADPKTLYDVRIDGPTMPVIDPVKDRAGFALDQENGWDSRHGIIRRMGRVPDDVDAERDTDPAQVAENEQIPDQSTENPKDERASYLWGYR